MRRKSITYVYLRSDHRTLFMSTLQIHHECVKDNFEVFVRNLNGGEKYTLQIAAKLISKLLILCLVFILSFILTFEDGKETCRSDPIEFTVPTEDKNDDQEILTVLNEPIPHNLPGLSLFLFFDVETSVCDSL